MSKLTQWWSFFLQGGRKDFRHTLTRRIHKEAAKIASTATEVVPTEAMPHNSGRGVHWNESNLEQVRNSP